MEKIHVIATAWVEDGYHGIHLPPGTEGDVVGKGSVKDFRVKWNGSDFVLEMNKEEVISAATH